MASEKGREAKRITKLARKASEYTVNHLQDQEARLRRVEGKADRTEASVTMARPPPFAQVYVHPRRVNRQERAIRGDNEVRCFSCVEPRFADCVQCAKPCMLRGPLWRGREALIPSQET